MISIKYSPIVDSKSSFFILFFLFLARCQRLVLES
jgi:hypothetical protein